MTRGRTRLGDQHFHFNGTCISQLDYNLEAAEEVYLTNTQAARLAKQCTAGAHGQAPWQPASSWRGAIGPTNKTLSVSPFGGEPGLPGHQLRGGGGRPTSSKSRGCTTAGVDLFLVETIFDTLNAKAAIYALERFFEAQAAQAAGLRQRHHRGQLRWAMSFSSAPSCARAWCCILLDPMQSMQCFS